MQKFGVSTYSRKKPSNLSGNRRSICHYPSNDVTGNTIGMMYSVFDLLSRHICQYIIKDLIFLSVDKLVTIIIDSNSGDSNKWQSIAEKQLFGYEIIMISERSYFQIPSRIRSNNRKGKFVSGHRDNDLIAYLVLNKGVVD